MREVVKSVDFQGPPRLMSCVFRDGALNLVLHLQSGTYLCHNNADELTNETHYLCLRER